MKLLWLNVSAIIIAILTNLNSYSSDFKSDTLSIDGIWRFQLDPMGFGKTPGSELCLKSLSEIISLPGSTDTNGKGFKNTASYIDRLTRKYEYYGMAWYQREIIIPESWCNRDIQLHLERCHWFTTVYVDGIEFPTKKHLSTPNRWDLTEVMSPGRHILTICIDNRIPFPMDHWNHGTTEYTQTNWNGVTGNMILTAKPKSHIINMQIYPDIHDNSVKIRTQLKAAEAATLHMDIINPDNKKKTSLSVNVSENDSVITSDIHIENPLLWDEFQPQLYKINAALKSAEGEDRYSSKFGMREVTRGDRHLKVNDIDRHFRGTLDCAVWPLTGYPSTDVKDWLRVMSTIKEYGMNHVRFHSWCPPESAFEAADQLGLYLQIELPMWIKDVGQHPERREWFEQEMYAILDEYGNHPSFILYCNGNENEGDFSVLNDLTAKGKGKDPRHLYSASTARSRTASDQFYVSHVTDNGWITVYEGKPATNWDVNNACNIDVPVIAHETGQRCMYPNFKEMSKYKGVLEPRNMEVFIRRLAKNAMLHQADDFFQATGAHTVLQYKEVNESLLRSDCSGGFQLLGLQDFPGQGSAFVGILDAFWESKGLVKPEKFRESCAPEVLLCKMPKRVYSSDDKFEASIHFYNFGPKNISKGKTEWYVSDKNGTILKRGNINHNIIARSIVDSIGNICMDLRSFSSPGKYILHVSDKSIHNEWDFWVYPKNYMETSPSIVTDVDEALRRLSEGENVLLIPDNAPGRKTHFASHFWNPVMFNWDPMIVGTLIDNTHGAFKTFPTESYANWQWYDILNNAKAMDMTSLTDITPVIQSIDSYETNRKLGIAFEANVDNGKLFILCVDPITDIDNRPASRQLISSISDYINSDSFHPKHSLAPHQIKQLFYPLPDSNKNSSSKAIIQLYNE